MNKYNQVSESQRSRILNDLRTHFGEDRSGDLADIDGLGLLSTFLRRIPGAASSTEIIPEDVLDEELSRQELKQIRRRRFEQKSEQPTSTSAEQDLVVGTNDKDQETAAQAISFSALIDEIPRLRENFAEWLGSVDADYLPSSSTPEELERLRDRAEYRLRVLKIMLSETQKELDALMIAIRAAEAVADK